MSDLKQLFLFLFLLWNVFGVSYLIINHGCYRRNNKQKLFVSLFCGPLSFIVQVCICIYEWLGDKYE
jgi:hypothetical protein